VLTLIWTLIFIASIWILAFQRASLSVWTISFLLLLLIHSEFSTDGPVIIFIEAAVVLILAIVLNIWPLRRLLFSSKVLTIYRRLMPRMSSTEREALEAGSVGWEGDLFSGMPDWQKLLRLSAAKLSEEEQAFLDGPVEELCRMTDDWDITHNRADLTPKTWQFIKDQGFFGLIIPKHYGGKEFSACAHAAILTKLYAHSLTLASTVSVPNSLGPAELLLKYGTEQQKNYYLPRLASGEEVPCFALTNPEAGSDAGSIPDTGIVCKGQFEGKEVIGIRINCNKRYITLAPIATIIGMAFKLYDPDHLLGDKENIGITCALIPRNTAGIEIGRRHFPLNIVFQNGPIHGKDVFIPVDWIIGGKKMAGHGWRMLMECLAVGRAVSLPSSAVGGSKMAAWATGAYARIRRQFNLPIGRFEGIEEALARIGGHTYMIDATAKFVLAAIDRGEKPAVPSAILKYHATELGRQVTIDAMDIHGGRGICLGPRNYLGRGYQGTPIAITVEGANILTRSLIIFGQGAIRCHPYVYSELNAAQDKDEKRALKKFDKALFGHMGFFISNLVRSFTLGLTAGRLVSAPHNSCRRYYQQFSRFSAVFALLADAAMLTLGGDLKRKERLSARLGDILSALYMGCAVLKWYAEQGSPEADRPLVVWSCCSILFSIEKSIDELLRNFPNRLLARVLRFLVFPFGEHILYPSDRLDHKVASLLLSPTDTRTRLTQGAYLATDANNPLAILAQALEQVIAAEPLEKKKCKPR